MHEIIENLIKEQASPNEPMHILEAACGEQWPFRLEGINYVLTGVDMDKDTLRIRENTLSELHETIDGDLCTVDHCDGGWACEYAHMLDCNDNDVCTADTCKSDLGCIYRSIDINGDDLVNAADLASIFHQLGLCSRLGECGQEQSDEQCDDCHDHEQLNEGKTTLAVHGCVLQCS